MIRIATYISFVFITFIVCRDMGEIGVNTHQDRWLAIAVVVANMLGYCEGKGIRK